MKNINTDSQASGLSLNFTTALFVLLVMFLLPACQSLDSRRNEPLRASQQQMFGNTLPDGSIRYDTDSPRIAQLWSAAERAKNERKWDEAERYIDEALQLEPQNAILWSRAAELKMTVLEPKAAEMFALRSINYASDNRVLLHRNWLIIEHAREMQGDMLGARQAHKQVQTYLY